MLRTLFCCIIVTTLLSSCGFYEHRERQQLYSQIKLTNDSLDRMTKEWHILLDGAVKSRNFYTLNPYRIQLGQFLSRRRSMIAEMEIPADAETLRGSEGFFLTTQAATVSDIYPGFELFNDLTPDSSIQTQLRLVSKDLSTEVSWNLTIRKALDAFARKNGIRNSR